MLFSFILAIVYRCVLKAMLILPRVHLPFDNLEQLVQTGIHVAVGEGTSIHVEIMLAANTSSVGQLRDVVVPVPAKHTKLYNLKVMEGHLAGMRTRTVANFIVNDDFAKVGVCRAYIMSRGFFGPNILSIAFPKGSQLKQQFDSIIVRFREFGIIKKEFGDALTNATDCFKPFHATITTSKTRPLHLEDLFGVFFLLAAGIFVAAFVFLAEVTVGHRRNMEE
ncbi:uncharacterized protein LOC135103703 [Scylla paramamosain]|uniref:uncharacterized protein LOC135103703 n=1 Tax=Scylla paramamosain TaxID=85552 RepID=UPI003082C4BA